MQAAAEESEDTLQRIHAGPSKAAAKAARRRSNSSSNGKLGFTGLDRRLGGAAATAPLRCPLPSVGEVGGTPPVSSSGSSFS